MLKSFVIGGLAAMSLALTVQAEERIQFPAGYEDKMLNYSAWTAPRTTIR